MKVVILAGGKGTRISEETTIRPKPMVEIGGKPILWHLMKVYALHGFNDFVICCGYKGYMLKEFFANYALHSSDVTYDFRSGTTTFHDRKMEPWTVTLVDTGEDSMTGGRIKRVAKYVGDETFCCTYGDGLSNVNITELVAFHKRQGTLATMTAVQPPGRFGSFTLPAGETRVDSFREKPKGDGAWINGGFFVLEPGIFDYIDDDLTTWEQEPLMRLSENGELSAYRHEDFWQPMDTLRDKHVLEEIWATGKAPWTIPPRPNLQTSIPAIAELVTSV